jgi:hypothetical protein
MKNADILEKYASHFVEDFYGIESPEEWADTIDECLQKLVERFGDNVKFTQIKEKCGGLRVYFDFVHKRDADHFATLCNDAWGIVLEFEAEIAIKFPNTLRDMWKTKRPRKTKISES